MPYIQNWAGASPTFYHHLPTTCMHISFYRLPNYAIPACHHGGGDCLHLARLLPNIPALFGLHCTRWEMPAGFFISVVEQVSDTNLRAGQGGRLGLFYKSHLVEGWGGLPSSWRRWEGRQGAGCLERGRLLPAPLLPGGLHTCTGRLGGWRRWEMPLLLWRLPHRLCCYTIFRYAIPNITELTFYLSTILHTFSNSGIPFRPTFP